MKSFEDIEPELRELPTWDLEWLLGEAYANLEVAVAEFGDPLELLAQAGPLPRPLWARLMAVQLVDQALLEVRAAQALE